jgi:hypothetical protein
MLHVVYHVQPGHIRAGSDKIQTPDNCNAVFTHRDIYQKKSRIYGMMLHGVIKKMVVFTVLLALTGTLAGACYIAAEPAGDAPPENFDACWYCIDTCVADHPPFSDPFGYLFCIFGCTFSCHAPDPVPFGHT